jgi:hypothetical protein
MSNEPEKVQCPNCWTIYEKPTAPLANYYCRVCGRTQLVPVLQAPSENQAGGALVGAALGAAVAGLPGAVVGGIVGLLLGSSNVTRTSH